MKSNSKKALALLLLTSLMMTGCNQGGKGEETPDDQGGDEVEDLSVKSVSLNHETLKIEEEETAQLIATINPTNAKNQGLTWTSSDEEVAMVNGLGKVRALSKGTTTITVASNENPEIKATCVVEVSEKDRKVYVTGIAISGDDVAEGKVSVDKGDIVTLNATVSPDNATDDTFVWSSSNEEIATVVNGVVRGLKKGTATITATTNGTNAQGQKLSDSVEVTVIDNYIAVENVAIVDKDGQDLESIELTVVDNPTGKLYAVVTPEAATNKAVAWSVSQGEDLITVDSKGEVTLKVSSLAADATAKIKVASVDDPTKYDECTVTIHPESQKDTSIHVTGIKFATCPKVVDIKSSTSIVAALLPADTGHRGITWSVTEEDPSNPTGATIVETVGNETLATLTTGKIEGTIILKAKADDETNGVFEVSEKIEIRDSVIRVSSIDFDDTFKDGFITYEKDVTTLSGHFTVSPSTANQNVVFTSSNENVATVNNSGKITANAEGTTTITATSVVPTVDGENVTKSFVLTVKKVPVSRVELSAKSATLDLNKSASTNLTASVHYKHPDEAEERETVTTKVNWVSDDPTIATVNAGHVEAKKVGTTTIRAISQEDSNIFDECEITVVDTLPIIASLKQPTNIEQYLSSVDENNLTDSSEGVYNRANADKGSFFTNSADKMAYKVGNMGDFFYLPTAIATYRYADGTESSGIYENIELDYSLTKDGNPVAIADFATLDVNTGAISFKAGVKGDFELTASVKESSNYIIRGGNVTKTFAFTVVDGYNVYNLAGLSLFDNYNGTANHVQWGNYRRANGINISSADVDALIMHSDIAITADVFDDSNIWTKDDVDSYLSSGGSSDFATWKNSIGLSELADQKVLEDFVYNTPIDGLSVFERNTTTTGYGASHESDSFVLEGNFFCIDMSTLKQVVFKDSPNDTSRSQLVSFKGGVGSISQLFGVNAKEHIDPAVSEEDTVTFNNIEINGNASLDASKQDSTHIQLAKGGLIAFKAGNAHVNFNNILNHGAFTGFHTEQWKSYLNTVTENRDDYTFCTFDRVKCFDTYNSSFYMFSSRHNIVKNSWLTGAGGPLFFMDEHNYGVKNDPSSYTSREDMPVEVTVTNTYMYNLVVGTEAWFADHKPSGDYVRDHVLNQGLTNGWVKTLAGSTGKTITTTIDTISKINFIVLDCNAGSFLAEDYFNQLSGTFTVTNGDESLTMDMSKAKKDAATYGTTELVPTTAAAYIAQSSKGGIGYYKHAGYMLAEGSYGATEHFNEGNYMSYYVDFALLQALTDYDDMHLAGTAQYLANANYGNVGIFLGTF